MSNRATEAAPARKSKRKKKRPKSRRPRVGLSFELRARDALAVVHPEHDATHNERLRSRYGRMRQFDVGLRDAMARIDGLFEAKDHRRRTGLEKVEAFETKVRELAEPIRVAGLVSASGFQEGAIQRARGLGDEARVRELYQLRSVEPTDWSGRIRNVEMSVNAMTLIPKLGMLSFASGPSEVGQLGLHRNECFIEDSDGHVVGNLLDLINARIRALNSVAIEGPLPREIIAFPPNWFMKLEGRNCEVRQFEFAPTPVAEQSTVRLALDGAVRDLMIDAVHGRTWMIPDPDRRIRATRTSMDLSVDFAEGVSDPAEVLCPTPEEDSSEGAVNRAIVRATQWRILMLAARAGTTPDAPPPKLKESVEAGNAALARQDWSVAGNHYRESFNHGLSVEALINLGFIEATLGRHSAALDLSFRAIRFFPMDVTGYSNAIHMLVSLGQFREARRILNLAHMFHAGRPELFEAVGELGIREGDLPSATSAFIELLTHAPTSPTPRMGLASIASARGDHEIAAYEALEAWRLGERTPVRLVLILDLLLRARRREDALAIGEEVLAHSSERRLCRRVAVRVAAVAYELDNIDAAERTLPHFHERDPMHSYVKGLVAARRGNATLAHASFSRYVEQRPNDSRGRMNLAASARALSRHADALRVLRDETASATLASQQYWGLRTMCAAGAGDSQEALSSATEAATRGGDHAAILLRASVEAARAEQIEASAELRLAMLGYATDDPNTVIEQAILKVQQTMLDGRELGAARLDIARAQSLGADEPTVVFARFLLAVHDEDDACTAIAALPEAARWTDEMLLQAAAVCEDRARSALALILLDRMETPVQRGSVVSPDPVAIRASALLRLERSDEALALRPSLNANDEHPFHHVVLAYLAYGAGDTEEALRYLDAAQTLFGGDAIELPLRLQLLAELGRYRDLLAELERHTSNEAVLAPLRTRVAGGDPDLEVARAHFAHFGIALAAAAAAHGGAEHIAVFHRPSGFASCVLAVHDCIQGLSSTMDPRGGVPIILRVTHTAWRTLGRLRERAR